jgi:hypothetical protein
MTAHEETYKGHTIKIEQDTEGLDPRKEYDNLGTMVCFHRRYNLGDKDHGIRHEDYSGWDEMEAAIRRDNDVAVILPIYMYDHSGITINTTGFSCPWDSGQIGFIFITKEKVREEYSVKRITKALRERIGTYLTGEVETYDLSLRGEVYGYVIDTPEEEDAESCWGFLGEMEHCLQEAKSVVDSMAA